MTTRRPARGTTSLPPPLFVVVVAVIAAVSSSLFGNSSGTNNTVSSTSALRPQEGSPLFSRSPTTTTKVKTATSSSSSSSSSSWPRVGDHAVDFPYYRTEQLTVEHNNNNNNNNNYHSYDATTKTTTAKRSSENNPFGPTHFGDGGGGGVGQTRKVSVGYASSDTGSQNLGFREIHLDPARGIRRVEQRQQHQQNTLLFRAKLEIEEGLFRRCTIPYATTRDLFEQLKARAGGILPIYYTDDEGDAVVVDCEEDMTSLLELFPLVSEDPSSSSSSSLVRLSLRDPRDSDIGFCERNDRSLQLTPADLVKIVNEHGHVRLDASEGRGVRTETDVNEETPTTRLKLKRLDGTSEGFVSTDHVIGVYSQDDQYRLCLSNASAVRECPASRDAPSTLFHIRRVVSTATATATAIGGRRRSSMYDSNLWRNDRRPLRYGETVGIFSHDAHNKRLDVGPGSMMRAIPAHYNSWSTRLRVKKFMTKKITKRRRNELAFSD